MFSVVAHRSTTSVIACFILWLEIRRLGLSVKNGADASPTVGQGRRIGRALFWSSAVANDSPRFPAVYRLPNLRLLAERGTPNDRHYSGRHTTGRLFRQPACTGCFCRWRVWLFQF